MDYETISLMWITAEDLVMKAGDTFYDLCDMSKEGSNFGYPRYRKISYPQLVLKRCCPDKCMRYAYIPLSREDAPLLGMGPNVFMLFEFRSRSQRMIFESSLPRDYRRHVSKNRNKLKGYADWVWGEEKDKKLPNGSKVIGSKVFGYLDGGLKVDYSDKFKQCNAERFK